MVTHLLASIDNNTCLIWGKIKEYCSGKAPQGGPLSCTCASKNEPLVYKRFRESKEGEVLYYTSKERKRMRIWPVIYSICASVGLESRCRKRTDSFLLTSRAAHQSFPTANLLHSISFLFQVSRNWVWKLLLICVSNAIHSFCLFCWLFFFFWVNNFAINLPHGKRDSN